MQNTIDGKINKIRLKINLTRHCNSMPLLCKINIFEVNHTLSNQSL